MQAFKLYFKIFKRSALASMMIYVVIFGVIMIMYSSTAGNNVTTSFTAEKCKVAVINNDNSEFSDTLENYIEKRSASVKIKNDDQSIKDAMFFRKAEYILIIPDGYGEAFLNGTQMELKTKTIPNSTSGIFMDLMVNNYLKTFKLYKTGASNLSFDQIAANVKSDLAITTKVDLTKNAVNDQLSLQNFYFDFLGYPLICVLILGVAIVMNIINAKDVKRRNLCSPINSTKFSLQIFLGNAVLAIVIWALFSIYPLIVFRSKMLNFQGFFFFLNSFIFVLVCLSLSFLIGNIASKNAVNPIANVLGLGGAFLGGAFVPQSMLSDTVKNIAVIDPIFWFVKANDIIGSQTIFDAATTKPILSNMLIELAFAAAFLAIALVIIKQKRTSN